MADKKQINPKKPIPASGYDRLRNNLTSNFADGFPVENFPNPDNRANINRGTITTLYISLCGFLPCKTEKLSYTFLFEYFS